MKVFVCLGFILICFSSYAQQDTTKIRHQQDSIRLANAAQQEAARQKFKASRDSIITAISLDIKVPKGKLEDALAAFTTAVKEMQQVSNNDDLTPDQKSGEYKIIAERREAVLQSILNSNQLEKLKGYIIRRQIPKKVE
jgi:hypothetical protein